MEDFAHKMLDTKLIAKSKMVQLIKAGCFTELHSSDRKETMRWYLRKYAFAPSNKITMQQFAKMTELGIIPESLDLAKRMVNFKKYVLDDEGLYEKHIDEGKKVPKRGYHDGYYILDNNSQPFFKEYFTEDSVVKIKGEYYIVSEKLFTKEVDKYIQPLKDWFDNSDTLNLYNEALFKTVWNQYADGTLPSWSMQALSFYDGEHELENINEELYGMAEHSPIRAGYFLVKIYNAPQFVHGHLVRHHIGATPFISTLRPDRTDYDKVPDRNTLQDGEYLFNFQSIINISRKRLCNCASYETRYVWLNVLEEIKAYEPELVKICRRECVYRGFCPEMFQCKQKYTETKAFKKELAEYRGTICRNN